MMQLLKNLNQVLRVIKLVAAYLVEVVPVPVCMLHEFCNGAALKPTRTNGHQYVHPREILLFHSCYKCRVVWNVGIYIWIKVH